MESQKRWMQSMEPLKSVRKDSWDESSELAKILLNGFRLIMQELHSAVYELKSQVSII